MRGAFSTLERQVLYSLPQYTWQADLSQPALEFTRLMNSVLGSLASGEWYGTSNQF